MQTKILPATSHNIRLAAREIQAGGIVAFPTETVYGLGADALNAAAAAKIYTAKGRAQDNPLIIHLDSPKKIEEVAYHDPRTDGLIKKFMPGALTLVLKKKPHIPFEVTGGLDTVAVRIPSNPVALKFIKACNTPIAAPSANSSGSPSPTQAAHVYDDLNGKIAYILDGGGCEIGLESTIIDFSSDRVRLLRLGGIPIEELADLVGDMEFLTSAQRPLAPGMKYRHYAPKARVYLCEYGDKEGIERLYSRLRDAGQRVVLILNSQLFEEANALFMSDSKEYARRLFYELRKADRQKADAIICEKAADTGIGRAVNSRLEKAGE